jgi:hypothetical protein
MASSSSPTPFKRFNEEDPTLLRLELRLNEGYEMIERRREAGLDVSKLEDFWIELLHEYEDRCNDHHPIAA